jgi:hypothetical protein
VATPGKAGNDAELYVQLIQAFGAPRPNSLNHTELFIALINAVENFGGGGSGNPSDTVTPATSFGIASNAGVSGLYSRGDHTHGTPALSAASSSTGPAGFGTSPVVGTSLAYARQDHTHGNPTFPGTAQLAPVACCMGAIPTGGVLTGLPVVDGVQTTVGMRVLVPHLNADYGLGPVNDGVWLAQSGTWTRPTDFSSGTTFTQAFVMILGGQYRGGTLWACTSESAITIDTDDQTWFNVAHDPTDPGYQYMVDYLEPVDLDNPWTDPAFAYGVALQALPLVETYRANGTAISGRDGVIQWPETPVVLPIGWAAAISTHGNPNAWAKTGCIGDTGKKATNVGRVRNVGLGSDTTKLFSCFPQVFATTAGSSGGTGWGQTWARTPGHFDRMTIDGSFSPCGTGWMSNATAFMHIEDLTIRNFGPSPAPTVTAGTIGGSTLQAGGWEVICTVSGSLSTSGWSGTGWQGWAVTGGGTYTLGPLEGQPSPPCQIITTSGQGLTITPPAQNPLAPWGRNYWIRPIMQYLSDTAGGVCSGFTGTQTLTVDPSTPPTGMPSSNGGFFVIATDSTGEARMAKMTYGTLSGNTFSNVNYHNAAGTAPNNATLTAKNLMWDATANFNLIAANQSDGTAPSGTPFTWATAWASSGFSSQPSSLGYMGLGAYITAGPNAPADVQAFSEKLRLNMNFEGNGTAIVIDGAKSPNVVAPGGGMTSFEYSDFEFKIMCPPDQNGLVVTNGAWPNHSSWDIVSNWYQSFDAGYWWGNIQGASVGGNAIPGQITFLIVTPFGNLNVAGGGVIIQAILGGVITNTRRWSDALEYGTPGSGGNGSFAPVMLAGSNAVLDPIHVLVDCGGAAPYPPSTASAVCNLNGMSHTSPAQAAPANAPSWVAMPASGLGSVSGGTTQTGGGALVFGPLAQNGVVSINGSTSDAKMAQLAHTYSATKNVDNPGLSVNGVWFVRV